MAPTLAILDLEVIRSELRQLRGPRYWRSLEELANGVAFQELVAREFPEQAAEWHDPVSRRRFLALMAASLGLAGVAGCARAPAEKIVPFVRQPERLVPGRPDFYATALPLAGDSVGVLVESHMGRPIKIEGNPDHPASLGATDAFAQAAILTLYDPDRSKGVWHRGQISTWSQAISALRAALDEQLAKEGAGLRVLTEVVRSPTFAHQLQLLLERFPRARWHQYEPVSDESALLGAKLAYGDYVSTSYALDGADVTLAIDCDFLSYGPGHLRYVRDFTDRRRVWKQRVSESTMNRLYVIETELTRTGAKADHRLSARPSETADLTAALVSELGIGSIRRSGLSDASRRWVAAVARDLNEHRGRSAVLVGPTQPAPIHVLGHAINQHLGNTGQTVRYTEPVAMRPDLPTESLKELVDAMDAGAVDLLLMIGGNPVYNAPIDFRFAEQLTKVPFRAHMSLYDDETSELAHWHIPETHLLESWGDTRAFDGTVSVIQPLIAPLYDGRSPHELLAALLGGGEQSAFETVRGYWREHWPERERGEEFDDAWQRALHDGWIPGMAFAHRNMEIKPGAADRALAAVADIQQAERSGLEIVFRPDPTVYDGSFANNGWLQELPKPLTKLTWENVACLSPAVAQRLKLKPELGANGGDVSVDVLELRYRGRSVLAPAWVLPGHADDAVTVYLGYGRTRAGHVGNDAGYNAYSMRGSDAPWQDGGLELRVTSQRVWLAATQNHHLMHGRDLVRSRSLEEHRKEPPDAETHVPGTHQNAASGENEAPTRTSMYPDYEYTGYRWGMSIDLTSCTGCGACIVACQAENNIPVVGKAEVARSREMHWLRIDAYYHGELDSARASFMPVPCMQCERAPCEVVCPVAATVHSPEGLNDMVYNRCVGTRYCSNNCPYKVRRFNFLQYADFETPSLRLLWNPDVTVRTRGVMEKCTYCVQRIDAARIEVKKQQREPAPQRPGVIPIYDGEVVTACAAACPAEAIVFGDLNGPSAAGESPSKVARMKATQLNYALLGDLNTQPRTTYLTELRNFNPEIENVESISDGARI